MRTQKTRQISSHNVPLTVQPDEKSTLTQGIKNIMDRKQPCRKEVLII